MKHRHAFLISVFIFAAPALAQQSAEPSGLRAHLKLQSPNVAVGRPIWAVLSLENTSDKPITLTVEDAEVLAPSLASGLPLAHVFSGPRASGLTVQTNDGRSKWEVPKGFKAPKKVPALTLSPHGVVGVRVDLKEYYSILATPGRYRINWSPYGGTVKSEIVSVEVAPLKQAEIITDVGKMTVRFFYDAAPKHVANFIELADKNFYSGLKFHRLEPGYMLLGGCPKGDGTGIRPDGVRIPAEFNGHEHKKGTVSMALLEDDPQSASCQFFISNTRQKDWDGRYTVFGELVGRESLETLDKLMAAPVDESGQPTRPLLIRSIRIVNAPSNTSKPFWNN